MIDVSNYAILKDNVTTMKQASKDSTNEEYMTECTVPVVNFDKVTKEYCRDLRISSIDSNDALIVSLKDDTATFIEFKNGFIDKKIGYSLQQKIYDSILVFTDITCKGVSEMRERLNYILVYNRDRHPDNRDSKTRYNESESRDNIGRILMRYGNERYVKFGLGKFERYCFNQVNTYTKEEFQEFFIEKLDK